MNPKKAVVQEKEVETIGEPSEEMTEFLAGLELLGQETQGIQHSEWWKEEDSDEEG